jgi:uncharacterized LabA/DUF88 family protein
MGDHDRDDSVTMGTLQESIKTINEQVQQQRKCERNKVGIFWDWENIEIPKQIASVPALLKNMRTDLLDYGKEIKQSRIYHDSSKAHSIVKHHRRSIANQGWEIVDCPCVKFIPKDKHSIEDKDKQSTEDKDKQSTEGLNVKEVVDKKIIVDIMEFAYDHYEEGATVVIISNDADYGYMLSRLRGKGVYVVVVYSILQHAEELLQVGDKAVHLSNFFEPDNASDRTAEETAADLIDDLDGTQSDAGSVQELSGYLYPLLKEIENVSRTHQHSRRLCPGKALFSEVGNRLKEVHGCVREKMWKEMRLKALREKLIEESWLCGAGTDSNSWRSGSDSEYTETKDPKAANVQKQLYFLVLTDKGRRYLDEARPQDWHFVC